jgi:phage major head subunit gpT-like protein
MSIIDQDIIDAASATFEIKFQEVFEHDDETPSVADAIGEIVPTESEENEVDLLGAMPVMKKWIGPKEMQVQRAYSQRVFLEKYEATFELPRMKVSYDKLGLIGRRIDRFMSRNRYWKEKILFDFLVTNPTGYDGVAFFSTAHPHGPGGNQSNTTTAALAVGTLDTAIQTMQSLRDENGENLGISPTILVTGPKLRKTAIELTGSDRIASVNAAGALDPGSAAVAAATFPNYFVGGFLDYFMWPRLVGTQDDWWMLFATTADAKAFLLYEGRAVEGIPQTDMNGEHRFINDMLRWSLESDHVPAAGAWQVAYGGIVA